MGERAAHGGAHPSTTRVVANLGLVLRDQGSLEEALVGAQPAPPARPPRSRGPLRREATRRGAPSEAVAPRRNAGGGSSYSSCCRLAWSASWLAGRRKALGGRHPDTLTAMGSYGDMLRRQGKLGEAQPLLEEALAGKQAVLGGMHPSTLNTGGDLGMLLAAGSNQEGALPLIERALAGFRATMGDEHPHTRKFARALAELLLMSPIWFLTRERISSLDACNNDLVLMALGTLQLDGDL